MCNKVPPDIPVKYVLVDPLLGRKEIMEAGDMGEVQAGDLLRSGIIPTLKWGRVKKVRASDFNKLINQAIEEGMDLLEYIQSQLPQKKSKKPVSGE